MYQFGIGSFDVNDYANGHYLYLISYFFTASVASLVAI